MNQNAFILEEILENIRTVLSNDIDSDILQSSRHGEVNFETIRPELEIVFQLLNRIFDADLSACPEAYLLRPLNNKIGSLVDSLKNIMGFSIKVSSPSEERDRLIVNFRNTYSDLFPVLLLAIQYIELTTKAPTITALTDQIKYFTDEIENTANKFDELVKSHTDTVNQTVQEFGMRRYAQVFITESNDFKDSARTWFIASMAFLIGTIIIGFLLLFVNKEFVDKLDVLQFTITKVVILTALFFGVNVCFKNYRAHKHNQILNKHRHNALLTFEAFTGSKEDEQTKSAVLLAATQTIFGNQSTGYNNNEASDADLPAKIVEIIKTPSTSK